MKYKQGEKMIVEITEVKENSYVLNRIGEVEPMEAKIRRQAAEITRLLAENKELKKDFEKSKIVNLNMGRLTGQNEAWELARKIASTTGGLSSSELVEIFNSFLPHDILSNNTYPEAAAKVAEWEKAKEEVKVGDVLENIYVSKVKCVVTNLYPDNMAYSIFGDGTAGMHELNGFKKTGRNIDIDGFLKQIGGRRNENGNM